MSVSDSLEKECVYLISTCSLLTHSSLAFISSVTAKVTVKVTKAPTLSDLIGSYLVLSNIRCSLTFPLLHTCFPGFFFSPATWLVESGPPTMEAQSPNQWTAREFPLLAPWNIISWLSLCLVVISQCLWMTSLLYLILNVGGTWVLSCYLPSWYHPFLWP